MRVLIVEPDESTCQIVEIMLKSEGVTVYSTDLVEEAVDLAKVYTYDLILCETRLPDGDGLFFLRQLRTAKVATPVMMLSGDASIDTKVRCFKAGADDYLTKPFHKDEMVMRLQAIVRRAHGISVNMIEVGNLSLDLDSKRVTVGRQRVHLTGKEYGTLEVLVLRRGVVLTKDGIMNQLYGGLDEPEVKIVDVFICKLRRKLRVAGWDRTIETCWGRGYSIPAEADTNLIAA